jgi:hypothetical protein
MSRRVCQKASYDTSVSQVQVVSLQKRSGYANTRRVNGRAVLGTALSFVRKQELEDESVDSFLNCGDIVGGGSAVEVGGLESVFASVSNAEERNGTVAIKKENERKGFVQIESPGKMSLQKGTVDSMGGAGLTSMEQVNGVGLVSDGRVSDRRTGCKSETGSRASVKKRVSREVSNYQPEAWTMDARIVDARTGETREEQSLAEMTEREEKTGTIQREEEQAKTGREDQAWGEGALRGTIGVDQTQIDQTQNEKDPADGGTADVTSAEERQRDRAGAEPAQEIKDWAEGNLKGKEAGLEPALRKQAWAEGGLEDRARAEEAGAGGGIRDAALVESQREEVVNLTWEERVWAEGDSKDEAGTEGPQPEEKNRQGINGGMDDGYLVETKQQNETGSPNRGTRDWSEGAEKERDGAEERRKKESCEDGNLKEGRSAKKSGRQEAPAEPAATETECTVAERVWREGFQKGEAWTDSFLRGGSVAEHEGQAEPARKEEAAAERDSEDDNPMRGSGGRDVLVIGIPKNGAEPNQKGHHWEERVAVEETPRATDRAEVPQKEESQAERSLTQEFAEKRALETGLGEEGVPRDEVPEGGVGTEKTRRDGSRAEEAPAERFPNANQARSVSEGLARAEGPVKDEVQAGEACQEEERTADSKDGIDRAADAQYGKRVAERDVGAEFLWAEDVRTEDTPRESAWTEVDRAGGSLKGNRMEGAQAEATPAKGARGKKTRAEKAPTEERRAEEARRREIWADEVRAESGEENAETEALLDSISSNKLVPLETETAPGLGFQEAEPEAAESRPEHRTVSSLLVNPNHTLPSGQALVQPATEIVGGKPAERKTEQISPPSVMEVSGENRNSNSADGMKAGGLSRTASDRVERRSSRGSTDYRMGDGLEMLLQGLVADEDEVSSEGSSETDEERGEWSGASYWFSFSSNIYERDLYL